MSSEGSLGAELAGGMATEMTETEAKKAKAAGQMSKELAAEEGAAAAAQARYEKKAPIRFKDACGRKFTLPFSLVRTWAEMEDLIRETFLHVDVIGKRVAEGQYDLIGPDGDIILPQTWETAVEPGWSVTMKMWPLPEPSPPRSPPEPGAPPPSPEPAPAPGTPASAAEKELEKELATAAAKLPKEVVPAGHGETLDVVEARELDSHELRERESPPTVAARPWTMADPPWYEVYGMSRCPPDATRMLPTPVHSAETTLEPDFRFGSELTQSLLQHPPFVDSYPNPPPEKFEEFVSSSSDDQVKSTYQGSRPAEAKDSSAGVESQHYSRGSVPPSAPAKRRLSDPPPSGRPLPPARTFAAAKLASADTVVSFPVEAASKLDHVTRFGELSPSTAREDPLVPSLEEQENERRLQETLADVERWLDRYIKVGAGGAGASPVSSLSGLEDDTPSMAELDDSERQTSDLRSGELAADPLSPLASEQAARKPSVSTSLKEEEDEEAVPAPYLFPPWVDYPKPRTAAWSFTPMQPPTANAAMVEFLRRARAIDGASRCATQGTYFETSVDELKNNEGKVKQPCKRQEPFERVEKTYSFKDRLVDSAGASPTSDPVTIRSSILQTLRFPMLPIPGVTDVPAPCEPATFPPAGDSSAARISSSLGSSPGVEESISDAITIRQTSVECFEGFEKLLGTSLEAAGSDIRQTILPSLRDEFGRLRIWASEGGALQTGQGSLDHKLQNKDEVAHELVSVLSDLRDVLQEGLDHNYPHHPYVADADTVPPPATNLASAGPESVDAEEAYDLKQLLDTVSLDSEDKQDVLAHATEPGTLAEWRQWCRMIAVHITSLFKLSQLIHKHLGVDGSSDMTDNADQSDYTTLPLLLYPRLQSKPWLLNRLGSTIAQRQRRLQDLASGPHHDTEATATDAPRAENPPAARGQGGRVPTRDKFYDPVRPAGSREGAPFECPFCRMTITVASDSDWRHHVFDDVRPYVCTFEACRHPPFARRREWFAHELAAHRREWRCEMCFAVCPSAAEFDEHLQRAHSTLTAATAETPVEAAPPATTGSSTAASTAPAPAAMDAEERAMFRDMCERPATTFSAAECPFCNGDDWAADTERGRQPAMGQRSAAAAALDANGGLIKVSAARFSRHVAGHLEQLALATLYSTLGASDLVQAVEGRARSDRDASDNSDEDSEGRDGFGN